MLPPPGSTGFTPLLVQHCLAELERTVGEPWDFDVSLFLSILMSMLVGGTIGSPTGGVIVDVLHSAKAGRKNPRTPMRRAAASVKGICEGIFGLETHHASLSESTRPSDLAYQFLVDAPLPPMAESSRSASVGNNGLGVNLGSTGPSGRSSRLPSFTASTKTPKEAGSPAARTRSQTFPLVRSKPSARSMRSADATASVSATPDRPKIALKRGSADEKFGADPGSSTAPPFRSKAAANGSSPVVAGDLTESPEHEGDMPLLHADIGNDSPPKNTRPPQVLVLSGLERCDRPVWVAVSDMLRTGLLRLRQPKQSTDLSMSQYRKPSSAAQYETSSNTPTDSFQPQRAGDSIHNEAESTEGHERATSIQSEDASKQDSDSTEYDMRNTIVMWLRNDEASERCPGWLIDHFSVGVSVDPLHEDFVVPLPSLPRQAIIPDDYVSSIRALLAYTHIHPPLATHISNLLSAISLHPLLKSTITSRCVRVFPDLVRAHRLLSGNFVLPSRWEDALARLQSATEAGFAPDRGVEGVSGGLSGGRWGLGGGKGGVDTWARKAGEEPMMLKELVMYDREEEGGEDWYATVKDVEGALWPAVRHRVSWRGERREVMWLLKGNAAGIVPPEEPSGKGTVRNSSDHEERGKKNADRIIQDILATV